MLSGISGIQVVYGLYIADLLDAFANRQLIACDLNIESSHFGPSILSIAWNDDDETMTVQMVWNGKKLNMSYSPQFSFGEINFDEPENPPILDLSTWPTQAELQAWSDENWLLERAFHQM